jgi:hypothetical protein
MSVADDIVEALGPWLTPDLQDYAETIGEMFEEVAAYVEDGPNGEPSWSVIFAPDLCPVAGLPYLAQWVGERLPVGISEANARQWIKDNPNQRRGTLDAIARAAERRLTAGTSQTVMLWPAHKLDGTPSLDYVGLMTFTAQTPDAGAVAADAQSVAPFDIVVDCTTVSAGTWLMLSIAYATWSDVLAACPTWADVQASQAGYQTWTR